MSSVRSDLHDFQKRQIDLIVRTTPYAMVGHVVNTAVIAVALAGSVHPVPLIIWSAYSCSTALLLLFRHIKNRGRLPRSFQRAAKKVTIYAFLLALPWSSLGTLYLGSLPEGQELILVALGIGMTACATVLLSAIPRAAFLYMSVILIPTAFNCLVFSQKSYFLLGALALSYWGCLATFIAKTSRDVRERQEAEVTLAERDALLVLAAKAGLVGSYVYQADLERMKVSEGYAAMHGLPEGTTETTRSLWRARVHSDDLAQMETLRTQSFIDRRREYNVDYRIVRGREVRWIESRSVVSYSSDGHPQGIIGVNIDVTERKKAEAALRESEARLAGQRRALELALNGAALETSLGVLVRTATDQLGEGVRAAFYLANSAHTGLHHVVGMPAGYAEAVDGFEIGPASLSCGLAAHTGLAVLTPDVAKEPRWTPWLWLAERFDFRGCWSFPIRTEAGRFVGTLAIYWRRPREATPRELELAAVLTATAAIIIARHTDAEQRDRAQDALRESEARLNAVIEGAADGILTIDEAGIVRSLNTAAVKMFGYAAEEVIGRNVRMLASEPYRSAHDGYLKRYRETREARIIGARREVEGRRKDGPTFPMDLAVAEMPSSGQRLFVGIVRDVTERKRAEERQRVLVAELDHRVKNALATVSSVVSHTRQGSGSVPDFAAALEGRLRSMAATHELLGARWWQGVSLTELVRRELAPYAAGNNTKISGPEVGLRAEAGQAMAMVLHELATNAAKYGALSTKKGRVSIRWDRRLNGYPPRLVLEWQEIGGPPVIARGNPSYGTSIIRELIPYEFGGTVDLVFAPEGVQCRLELPGDWLNDNGEPILQPLSDAHLRTGQGRI